MSNNIVTQNNTDVNINENNDKTLNANTLTNNIDIKKGRKPDEIRKYFVLQDTHLKCSLNGCTKTFAVTSSVTTLKYHISSEHEQIQNIKTKSVNMNNTMEKDNITEDDVYRSLAIAFSKNSLPHSLIEDEYFRDALTMAKNINQNLNKRKLRETMIIESDKINNTMLTSLALNGTPVTLAIDGWTNVRANKVTNLLIIVNGISYFIASIENDNSKNNVEWIVKHLEKKIDYLISQNIKVIAIATDNENLMKATCKQIKLKYPVIIDVPCAAHIIQLCFKKICEITNIKDIITEINEILCLIKNNKENRNKLYQLQLNNGIQNPLKILYYTVIRWSSLIESIKRLLLLENYLIEIINNNKSKVDLKINKNNNFWKNLKILYDFLKLFEICTNQIQKDNATLYAVWINFNKLIEYYNQYSIENVSNNEFSENAKLAVKIIQEKWDAHINKIGRAHV